MRTSTHHRDPTPPGDTGRRSTGTYRAGGPVTPSGPRGRLIRGNLRDFAADRLGAYTRWARDHGDVVPLRFGPLPGLLVTGPDAIRDVVVTHGHAFVRPLVLRQMQLTFGDGMLVASGPQWLRHRRIAQQAFHRPRIAAYGERMVGETERLLDSWRPGDRIDLRAAMAQLTLNIVARTLFDADVERDLPVLDDALTTAQHEFNAHMNSPLPLPDRVPTPGNLRLRRATRSLDNVIARLLDETRDADPDADHLMALLTRARSDDGDRLSRRELRDEAVTFLFAGHETTALLLSWTFALLSRHPSVRDRIEAELDRVLKGRKPTARDVGDLPATGRVLTEALRLYPPAYAFARHATRPVEIGGVPARKGTTVVVAQWVTHRDPRWFDRPDNFEPDRWADDLAARLPKFAYFPFGGGPHRCIGEHFAMLEATLALATIARRYRLDLEPSVKLIPEPLISLRSRDPLWARVRPRDTHD